MKANLHRLRDTAWPWIAFYRFPSSGGWSLWLGPLHVWRMP